MSTPTTTTDMRALHDKRRVDQHLRGVLKGLQDSGHLLPDCDPDDGEPWPRVDMLVYRTFYRRLPDGELGEELAGNERIAALRDALAADRDGRWRVQVAPTFDASMVPDLPTAQAPPETPDARDDRPHDWPSQTERVMTGILGRMERTGLLRHGARAEIEKALSLDDEARNPDGSVAVLFRHLANPATARRWLDESKAPDGVATFRAMLNCFPLASHSFDRLGREWAMDASNFHPDTYRAFERDGRRVSEGDARALAIENMAKWLHGRLEERENWQHLRPRYRPPVPFHERDMKAVLDSFAPELSPSVRRDELATKWAQELGHRPRHELARTVAERLRLWPDLRRDPEKEPKFDLYADPRFAEDAPDARAMEEQRARGFGAL